STDRSGFGTWRRRSQFLGTDADRKALLGFSNPRTSRPVPTPTSQPRKHFPRHAGRERGPSVVGVAIRRVAMLTEVNGAAFHTAFVAFAVGHVVRKPVDGRRHVAAHVHLVVEVA